MKINVKMWELENFYSFTLTIVKNKILITFCEVLFIFNTPLSWYYWWHSNKDHKPSYEQIEEEDRIYGDYILILIYDHIHERNRTYI